MEYYCLECKIRISDSSLGLCAECESSKKTKGFSTRDMKAVFNISKLSLVRLRKNDELHPTILDNGSWFFPFGAISAFIKKRPETVQRILRPVPKYKPEEIQGIIFEDFEDFEDSSLCKHCNKNPSAKSGYCLTCLDHFISKGEAMRLFNLSLSQFDILESQKYIKSYTFRTQKRYMRNEINLAIYQTLGTEKKWSPTRNSCSSCGRIDKLHYASGYCLECYKKTFEYYTLQKYISGYSFAEIGRTKGVSRERVRQLFEKAISNEAENIFGEKYSKEDLAVIREETKKENKLNDARREYTSKLLEKNDEAAKLVKSRKITSVKSLVAKLGLTAKAALILDEILPEVAEKLRSNTNKWALDYYKCVECGTTEVSHRAKGLCENCYSRSDYHKVAQIKWKTNNYQHFREKQIEYEREYNKRPEVKARVRKQSHKKRFGSNDVREDAISRFDSRCKECGIDRTEHLKKKGQDLSVLHIDGDTSNNDPYNLVPLCMSCSAKAVKRAQLAKST